MDAYALDPSAVRDISGVLLDRRAVLKVVAAHVLEATTPQERMMFGVRHGLYGFPTEDLCAFLR